MFHPEEDSDAPEVLVQCALKKCAMFTPLHMVISSLHDNFGVGLQ